MKGSRFFFCLVLVSYVLSFSDLKAQTWDEWFRPKKTQLDYLLKQVLLLESYKDALKESEKILGGGLDQIGSSKEQELDSHSRFFEERTQPRDLSMAAWQEIKRLNIGPQTLQQALASSENYWKAKSEWDHPRLWQWMNSIHSGMNKKLELHQEYLMQLLEGGLEMEDAKRAALILELKEELLQVRMDLQRVGVIGQSYMIQISELKRIER